jgi:Domain of unknown function (DUF4157)
VAGPGIQRQASETDEEETMTEAEPASAADSTRPLANSNPGDDDSISRKADLGPAAQALPRETGQVDEVEPVQRAAQPASGLEDKETINRKPADCPVVGLAGGLVEGDLERQIQGERGAGRPVPPNVRGKVGGALDADLSGVRVHTGQASDMLNRSLGAPAFTTGKDIFFEEGEYDPSSSGGQSLLAHELADLVQQGAAVRRRPNGGVQRATGNLAPRELGAAVGQAYNNARREW